MHMREVELLQGASAGPVEATPGPEVPDDPAVLVAELAELAEQAATEYEVGAGQGQHAFEAVAPVSAEKSAVLREIAQRMELRPGQSDYTLEPGYAMERVVSGLTYPTSVLFDGEGGVYVVEGGFTYGPAKGPARVLKVDGQRLTVVVDGLQGPVSGALWHQGTLYVAEGGAPGRISRVVPGQGRTTLVSGLRTFGDHYGSELALSPDGYLYFGVGTATNSGVVGFDNYILGWLVQHPHEHDVPARAIRLAGDNYWDLNWLAGDPRRDQAWTGAFKPFGTPARAGEVIRGRLMANGALYRVRLDGSGLEVVADGFRNVFGLRFSPDGRLLALNHGFDGRGLRPIEGDWDSLWEVVKGGWYGWPDFASGLPVTAPRFRPRGQPQLRFALLEHPPLAGQPLLRLAPHSASMKFDFAPREFGFAGQLFIAQFGPGGPMTMDPRAAGATPGFRVVRANPASGQVRDFYVNRRPGTGGNWPERPIDVKFCPRDRCLYLVDFGVLEAVPGHFIPHAGSGSLWRIRRA
ncbi:glucose/arabinose dehydrogenase [Symbiobacterium terraclitae]|uniref:Glucose/arabinose dehydrogenase n=1 Tax=Symbiobacterium terraclitae TaxID=557451 RepID=A0ABS4JY42_9FIRM|nr:glucose/arabinose dehydrogenase [Symbiobacterium terraclitae]